jgi:hypothetical protein
MVYPTVSPTTDPAATAAHRTTNRVGVVAVDAANSTTRSPGTTTPVSSEASKAITTATAPASAHSGSPASASSRLSITSTIAASPRRASVPTRASSGLRFELYRSRSAWRSYV